MYMTRVKLNPAKRETMRALANVSELHSMIENAFSNDRASNPQRRLWRLDRFENALYLLIVSEEAGDFSEIAKTYNFDDVQPETKSYDGFLDRLAVGQRWRFRLRANPINAVSQRNRGGDERGRIHAHVTIEQQKKWLMERQEKLGIRLDENTTDVIESRWHRFSKSGQGSAKVTFKAATYEGILTVTDVEKLRDALVNGVGRAKAYGCGLLTLASV